MSKLIFILFFVGPVIGTSQAVVNYSTPPKILVDLLLARENPTAQFDHKGEWMVLLSKTKYVPIEELAAPKLRVGGLQINTSNFSSGTTLVDSIYLKRVTNRKEYKIKGLPRPLAIGSLLWSPHETKIAFTQLNKDRVDLYVIDLKIQVAKKINTKPVNATIGESFAWIDENKLIYKQVCSNVKGSGQIKKLEGPVVSDSREGKLQTSATLGTSRNLFGEFCVSQLVIYANGIEKTFGVPEAFTAMAASPDEKCILLTSLQPPFYDNSHYFTFKSNIAVKMLDGEPLISFNDPSLEKFAPGRAGPVSWRNDLPATLVWFHPDSTSKFFLYYLSFPFKSGPDTLFSTKSPLVKIYWGNNAIAVVNEEFRKDGTVTVKYLNPAAKSIATLYSGYREGNPFGNCLLKKNKSGLDILFLETDSTFLVSDNNGGIVKFNTNGSFTKLWKPENSGEFALQVYDKPELSIVTRKNGNYNLHILGKQQVDQPLTTFDNPFAALEGSSGRVIQYKRKDGVVLSGTLYLPPGYSASNSKPLPFLIWGYPRRFIEKDQYKPQDEEELHGQFSIYSWEDPRIWLSQGYGVFEAGIVVLPRYKGENANDHLIEDLVMSAEATVNKLVEIGVADKDKIAIGGHSYGGFMAANLLAHTNLFKAGIAMAGIYNTTIYPLGFQGETRTIWDDPKWYIDAGAYFHANQIKAPLLIIHGDSDAVSSPMDSDALFNAVKANGGIARLVKLPYEDHGYRAKENVLQLLWEESQWLGKYLK